MSFISIGENMLTNGAKLRLVLKGKQLEALPVQLRPLIKNIDKPVVHVGINGRGAEGSMYGIKVFAKGRKEPVAAAAGRIDYRGAEPMLQARGFVRKNTGTGDAFRANVQMDTSKAIDLEKMDELVISQKKGEVALNAKSDVLNADVFLDKDAAEELVNFAGPVVKARLVDGQNHLAKTFERLRENLAKKFRSMEHPFGVPKTPAAQPQDVASKVSAGVADKTMNKAYADIEKYIADNQNLLKKSEKDLLLEELNGLKQYLSETAEKFANTTSITDRTSLASTYKDTQKKIVDLSSYINSKFD